jgi:hypothetical protein
MYYHGRRETERSNSWRSLALREFIFLIFPWLLNFRATDTFRACCVGFARRAIMSSSQPKAPAEKRPRFSVAIIARNAAEGRRDACRVRNLAVVSCSTPARR